MSLLAYSSEKGYLKRYRKRFQNGYFVKVLNNCFPAAFLTVMNIGPFAQNFVIFSNRDVIVDPFLISFALAHKVYHAYSTIFGHPPFTLLHTLGVKMTSIVPLLSHFLSNVMIDDPLSCCVILFWNWIVFVFQSTQWRWKEHEACNIITEYAKEIDVCNGIGYLLDLATMAFWIIAYYLYMYIFIIFIFLIYYIMYLAVFDPDDPPLTYPD